MTLSIWKTAAFAAVMLFATTGVIMLAGCSSFGSNPAGEDLLRVEQSPHYDTINQQFFNPMPINHDAMMKDFTLKDTYKFFFSKEERAPEERMPEVTPDMRAFASTNGSAQAIWFGHSSLLLRVSGRTILLDPVFGPKASPVPFTVGRFQKPVLPMEGLPEIDYIVISHDHYDHLDMPTIKHFRDRKTHFFVPLGVGSHLRGWGIEAHRITELDWWESARRDDLEFACTPAHHFSGRGLTDRNKTLWASWVIRNATETIFFSGDSGYSTHFKEIGDKYGPFDFAFMETGQYNNKWRPVHMLPEEAAQAYFDLKAKAYMPIHWAMFSLSMHTWYQPAMEIADQARLHDINLVTPRIGQTISLEAPPQTTAWWQPWVDPARPSEWYAQRVN